MKKHSLEFEKPLLELEKQLEDIVKSSNDSDLDFSKEISAIEKKIKDTKRDVYSDLTPWQKVQMSRHPNRPYSIDYIERMFEDFEELHGDRSFMDDAAIVGGPGSINGQKVMIISQQKGRNTDDNLKRNFGCPNPEGYRKALRLMKQAEKFNIPIITLIDTPGAFPGLEAEERGQGEAIARNIYEMMNISVPIISIVIGEGASGGALGIGVGDRILMLENTWYSVISPESCSSILWRSWEHKEEAAEALKLTASDMLENKLIDKIISEPLGGAHFDPEETYKSVTENILYYTKRLKSLSKKNMIKLRRKKFTKIGNFRP